MYSYLEEMKKDIKDYIESNVDLSEFGSEEELRESLNDELWIVDSVTGNGSGSYTFSREEARKNLDGNEELLVEALEEFGTPSNTVASKFLSLDFEYFDVTIRCYLLAWAIDEVIEEMEI